ncbi:MAG: molybdate ABC transporter permease subunit [Candidatus Sumerlaeota bacterium]
MENVLSSPEWSAVWISIKVAATSTACLLIPGIATGWLLARKRFIGKTILEAIVHLPLVLPPVVTGYVLLVILGRNGWIGQYFDRLFGIRFAFSWFGAVLAAMVVAFPLMVRSVRVAVELTDKRLESAARTLGAGPFETFFVVTLPLAAPGVLAGAVLAFARSLGEFGATITFAGNIAGETRTLPLAVFASLQAPGAEVATFRLVVLAILLSFGALIGSEIIARKYRRSIVGERR